MDLEQTTIDEADNLFREKSGHLINRYLRDTTDKMVDTYRDSYVRAALEVAEYAGKPLVDMTPEQSAKVQTYVIARAKYEGVELVFERLWKTPSEYDFRRSFGWWLQDFMRQSQQEYLLLLLLHYLPYHLIQ